MIINYNDPKAIALCKNCTYLICDVDNTVCESCSVIDSKISDLIINLSNKFKSFAFISGTDFKELKRMLPLNCNHTLLPVSGIEMYHHTNEYKLQYSLKISDKDRETIKLIMSNAIKKFNLIPVTEDQILDRRSQMTLSCIGRSAPKELKDNFDPELLVRKPIVDYIRKEMEGKISNKLSITVGGTTSIDVGYGKLCGTEKFLDTFKINKNNVVYIGDKFEEDGNDYPVSLILGCISVKNPNDFYELLLRSI